MNGAYSGLDWREAARKGIIFFFICFYTASQSCTSLHVTTLRVVYDASEYIQRSVVNRLVRHAPIHRNRTRLAKSRYNGPRPRDLFRCWLISLVDNFHLVGVNAETSRKTESHAHWTIRRKRDNFLNSLMDPAGALMAIAGVCYLTSSFANLLAPGLSSHFPYILLPAGLGELSLTCGFS